MAIEARRGCGYRKVGGLYLVSGGLADNCHRLPLPLHVCPTCHAGIKPARGWTWVGRDLLGVACQDRGTAMPPELALHGGHCLRCVICMPSKLDTFDEHNVRQAGRFGLLWIGEAFYPTGDDFMAEAARQGVSRRISAVPKDFEVGKTWVMMAHRKAIKGSEIVVATEESEDGLETVETTWTAGIVTCFRPTAIEMILRQSDATAERIAKEEKRGISVVAVPDGDPDHDPAGHAARQTDIEKLVEAIETDDPTAQTPTEEV